MGSPGVYRPRGSGYGRLYTVKRFPAEKREAAALMCTIRSPYLARCWGVLEDDLGHAESPPRRGIALVMEFRQYGSMADKLLAGQDLLSALELRQVALQLTAGLACLHAHKLVHTDITPTEIVIGSDRSGAGARAMLFKLAGFTLLKENFWHAGDDLLGVTVHPTIETAPELFMIKDRIDYGKPSSDVFSLGVVLFQLMRGSKMEVTPASPHDIYTWQNNVMRASLAAGTELESQYGELTKIVLGMVAERASARPSAFVAFEQFSGILYDDAVPDSPAVSPFSRPDRIIAAVDVEAVKRTLVLS